MPQLRSFSSPAGAPNLGALYLEGRGTAQRDRALTQRDTEIAQQGQLERERINASLSQSEMEAASKQAALQQQALMAAQELEVQKFINQQKIGLEQRALELQEQKINAVAEEALNQRNAQLQFQKMVEEDIRAGKKPGEAFSRATATLGPQVGFNQGAYGAMANPDGTSQSELPIPEMIPMEGEGAKGYRVARTGPRSYQVFPPEKPEPQVRVFEQDPSKFRIGGNRFMDRPQAVEIKRMEKRLDDVQETLQGKDWEAHRLSIQNEAEGKPLTARDRTRIAQWDAKIAERDAIASRIEELRAELTAPKEQKITAPEGIGGSSTNQVGRFKLITR